MAPNKLPKDWKWVILKDICEVVTGTTPPKSDMSNYGNEIPFFKPPHLWDGLISSTDEMLSSKGATKARVVPPNTVLVTCIGNLGRTGFVKKEAAFNQQINAILENDKIDGKYIFYQAQSPTFRNQLEKLATGTTVSIVNKGNFETIKIPLAPLETQQAIVSKIEELFSELDKGIDDLKTAQQQLKTYRQSVLKWAFEGKLTNDNVKKGELPKGWEYKTFNDIIEISKEKYKPINSESKFYIGLENIEKNLGALTPECGIEKIKTLKNKFNSGEILYGKLRPYLNKVYLAKENGVCSTDILVLKTRKNCNAQFLTHLMLGVDFVNTMSENTSGVNLPRVSTKFILEYPINLPPIEEQHQIVQEIESRLSVADKMEESIAQSLQQAEALRQSILKKAFSGELVEL